MDAMATVEKSTLHRYQKAIVFLQKEHHAMLQGLYDEIEKLQRRCAEMQFQLILNNVCPSDEGALREKIRDLEFSLLEKTQQFEDLGVELTEKKRVILHLEEQIQRQEERYQEDVSARNLIIVKLRREVQDKMAMIAYLASLQSRSDFGNGASQQSKNPQSDSVPWSSKSPASQPTSVGSSYPRRQLAFYRRLLGSVGGASTPVDGGEGKADSVATTDGVPRPTSIRAGTPLGCGVAASMGPNLLPPIDSSFRGWYNAAMSMQPLSRTLQRSIPERAEHTRLLVPTAKRADP